MSTHFSTSSFATWVKGTLVSQDTHQSLTPRVYLQHPNNPGCMFLDCMNKLEFHRENMLLQLLNAHPVVFKHLND